MIYNVEALGVGLEWYRHNDWDEWDDSGVDFNVKIFNLVDILDGVEEWIVERRR